MEEAATGIKYEEILSCPWILASVAWISQG
jgi:hypothetical protein